jgi:hypothetical protein
MCRVKAGILSREICGIAIQRARSEAQEFERHPLLELFKQSDKTTIADEEKHKHALAKVGEKQALLDGKVPSLGLAFIRAAEGADALSRLSRYETTIERSLFRNLHELQWLQAARRGHPIVPPVAVAVSVTGHDG